MSLFRNRTRHDPPWWARCKCCRARAEYRALNGRDWCWPCKYAVHPTCKCSNEETS